MRSLRGSLDTLCQERDVAATGGTRLDLAGQWPGDVTSEVYHDGHVLWGERGSCWASFCDCPAMP